MDNIYDHRLLVISPSELNIKNYAGGAYNWINSYGYDMLNIYNINPMANSEEYWMNLLNGKEKVVDNGYVSLDNIAKSDQNLLFNFIR